MDRASLRARQAPLKAAYREMPASAIVWLHAEGELDFGGIACRVRTRAGEVVAGLHEATGGDGTTICSGEMLLQALAACAGVTLTAVGTAMGLPLRSGRVRAKGEWDARGTLGVGTDAPVGFRSIHLEFDIESDASPEQLEKLLQLTERYCVVLQTLRQSPAMTSAIHRVAG
jgi:uncharacterized OsmC-like protein